MAGTKFMYVIERDSNFSCHPHLSVGFWQKISRLLKIKNVLSILHLLCMQDKLHNSKTTN